MINIRIPTQMRRMTNDQETVQAEGGSVGELLDALERLFPGAKERVCDQAGAVRRFVNIYVNGDEIRFLDGKATPVKDGDEVSIVAAFAGG